MNYIKYHMDGITKREMNLAILKAIQENHPTLKPMIQEIEQLMKQNKTASRVMKKLEIKFWPPKIMMEWEFPFKDKK